MSAPRALSLSLSLNLSLFACGGPAARSSAAPTAAAPVTLDAHLGALPEACGCSDAGRRLLDSSMRMGADGRSPQASDAVEAPAGMAGVFGAPRVASVAEEHTTIDVPVQGATLFGLPVAHLSTYWGHENGIGGMQVHFAGPRADLEAAVGGRLRSGDVERPSVLADLAPDGHAVLSCDWSM